MEALINGIMYLLSEPTSILILAFGVFFGIIFGCIPGLTATLGVILLIPFTFVMEPEQGMALLIGVYVGGISGSLITAILLNIPGTPSAIVTCWDGYPMGKKSPGKALSLGVFSSAVGGIVAGIALVLVSPQLARVGLMFGSWEYFGLMTMGMSVVVLLTSKDPIKGLMAAFLGLLFGTVGTDPVSGVRRLTFEFWELQAGVEMVAILMGFFAIREIMVQVKDFGEKKSEVITVDDKIPIFPSKETLKHTGYSFILGPIYGILIGLIPGVGQTTAGMMAYNQARQISKRPEMFGTGISEGIVTIETANNAVNGGALIPLITLGIPGDMVTAVLIGGLMIHGIRPGPLFFRDELGIVGAIFICYLLANIFMYIMELGLMRAFVQLVKVPLSILFPIIAMTCILGVYAANNRLFDVWILVIFGIVGYFLSEAGIPMPPIILGYILGELIESNFRTAMYASGGDVLAITTRPIAMVFVSLAIFFVVWPLIKNIKARMSNNTT